MRIAVCDDEELFGCQAKELIEKLTRSIDVCVDMYDDGKKLLDAFEQNPYDLLFLDIEMPKMDGISLAKKIREKCETAYIVFLTGHVEYALEGYEVNALRYLTKPIKEDKLKEVLRFVMDKSVSMNQLMIKDEGYERFINIPDIIYLEAQNQYVMIYTVAGDFLVRHNIGDYENELKNDGFFRVHRGYIVSLARVKKLVKSDIILEGLDGEVVVPVSRNKVKDLKAALYAYVEKEAF